MAHVVLIAGSPAAASRSAAVLETIQRLLDDYRVSSTLLSVRELPAEALLTADAAHPQLKGAIQAVEAADGVIVATPIYKAAYSGALKTFLDVLPQDALAGKVVLPIATGGSLAHLLAIEYSLKPVLAALGAKIIRGGVFLIDAQIARTADGDLRLEESAERRLYDAAHDFADHLPGVLGRITPDLTPTAKF